MDKSPSTSTDTDASQDQANHQAILGAEAQKPLSDNRDTGTKMKVRKRSGVLEPVDVNKIVRAVTRHCRDLDDVEAMRVATRTISGLYDGATTQELDQLSIQTAAALIAEEPEYSRLAARLLSCYIDKEVQNQEIEAFSQSIKHGCKQGLISSRTFEFVMSNRRKFNEAIRPERTDLFGYFGLRTVYDRYLLRDPQSRKVIETPQYFLLRVACGLSEDRDEAIAFYELLSQLEYLPSSPTLFNSGTRHTQLSSCYLLESPADDLEAIYNRYTDIAKLSKFAGGIGLPYHRVRSQGSLIRNTNGKSQGIVPFLKTLDSSVAAVNQGGRRKGACCVYLETWHADIEQFLELRDNTGDEARRTYNLHLANWIPDLFMQRVENDATWSLFDPKDVPHLTDLFGEEFEAAYIEAEAQKKYQKQLPARDLYLKMMRTLAQTGNGWMTFKDSSNRKSNQTGASKMAVHSSNLCTEIIEVTNQDQTAVCNLGSVNLAKFVTQKVPAGSTLPADKIEAHMDFERLAKQVAMAVTYLDRVIDINFYPTQAAGNSNEQWRPVGLGLMGLQDVFFQLRLPFDSPEAQALSTRIQEEIYFTALKTSCELAQKHGPHKTFAQTRMAKGIFQFDLWQTEPANMQRWNDLRKEIQTHGLRNSLVLAIAPTATIASISGCYECIEPQVSNLFKRETLSGDFLQINQYLVEDLKQLGLWTPAVRNQIRDAEGSVQDIEALPQDLRTLYRTAWELPQKALIDMAAKRGAYIDQSQSLNLFMETPTIGKLASMYAYAWKSGLKTTYYLRSRPATRIKQSVKTAETTATATTATATATATTATATTATATTATATTATATSQGNRDAEAIACSLENPESCESCQ